MPHKFTITERPGARVDGIAAERAGLGESQRREWRELEIDNGSHYLLVRIYDDGVLAIEQADYLAREPGDDTPMELEGEERTDAILAITNFLENL